MDEFVFFIADWLLRSKTRREWVAMFVILLGMFLVYLAYFR